MVCSVCYTVSASTTSDSWSLIDRGSNGGVAGTDVRPIHTTDRTVDIQGIDNHQVLGISVGTVGAYVITQTGPIIAIFHQYAMLGKGVTIHSPAQFEFFGLTVDDKSHVVGGSQTVTTPEGYVIPLTIQNGLARLPLRPFTDAEFDACPHVFFTHERTWDPSVLDHSLTDDPHWGVADFSTTDTLDLGRYNAHGHYRGRVIVQSLEAIDPPPQESSPVHNPSLEMAPVDHHHVLSARQYLASSKPDFDQLRPLFGWLPADVIRHTFARTTQYGRLPTGTHLKRSFKSANPALNVHRRTEDVACDIIYSDEPAVDDGSLAAVVFVGTSSMVTDVYGIKTDRQFVNTLEDQITDRGAPN
jgi:hypothetical protein